MAWHFFRKDFRLLWPIALALAATAALCAARTWVVGHFREPVALYQLTSFLPILLYLGIVLVTITAVHQDPLPGVRQDWLTRPVRRRDVWLSKLVFVLLIVIAPIFVIDVLEQLSVGLSFTMSLAGAASRALVLFSLLGLPALALGAITRSFTDALILGIVATVVISAICILGLAVLPPGTVFVGQQGSQWVPYACGFLVTTVAAAGTLWFQHTRRRTGVARGIALAGALMATATLVALPASATMEIQRWAWGRASQRSVIAMKFDPDTRTELGGQHLQIQNNPAQQDAASMAALAAFAQSDNALYARIRLPFRVEGMAPGSILRADRLTLRVVAPNGATWVDADHVCVVRPGTIGTTCRTNGLEIRADSSGAAESAGAAQVMLSAALYERIKNEPVTLQLGFSLTSFEPDPAQLAGTLSDMRQLAHLGSCATRIDADEDEVELRCLTSATAPSCVVAVLEDPRTQQRNPELQGCLPNYAPFPLYPALDVVSSVGISLPFRDPSGLAKYPVSSPAIAHARIRLTTFTPVSHFDRTISIHNVRLADWIARPPAP
jgi:hypothetical protein